MSTGAINWVILFVVLALIMLTIALAELNSRFGYLQKLNAKWGEITGTSSWAKLTNGIRVVSGLTAVGLFLFALIINLSTWFFHGVARYTRPLMLTHIAVLLVFFVACFFQQRRRRQKRASPDLPAPMNAIATALFIYVLALWAFEIFGPSRNQSAESHETSYNQTQLEKAPEDKKVDNDLRTLRGFSAFWMLFSFGAAANLLLIDRQGYKGPFGRYNSVVRQL